MASLVLGIGSSHGPSIQTEPENWRILGEKDTRDPRFDYAAGLKTARPGLDKEITIDIQRKRHAASHAALERLRAVIKEARLDALVVVSNAHNLKSHLVRPVFGILRSAEIPVRAREAVYVMPHERQGKSSNEGGELMRKPGEPALANHLIENLIGQGFDIALIDRLAEGTALDDAFSFTYSWLLRELDVPLVPFYLSRDLPNQASASRCFDLGTAIGCAVAAWPGDRRVGLVASGGLSHQVLDEDLDRAVVKALQTGDEAVLRALARDRLNRGPGTPEILNWVTVAAAMAPRRMELVDYIPAYRSLASTGHGLTFGFWR